MAYSGGFFGVELYPSGQTLLQVEGAAFSMSGRKSVTDTAGQPLFAIRKQSFSIPASYFAEDPVGNRFFEVQGQWSFGQSKAVGVFSYKDEKSGALKEGRLAMKGEYFGRRAEIVDESTGQVVALVNREFFSAMDVIGGQHTFVVTVAAGMDMALICAMCICMDARRTQAQRQNTSYRWGTPYRAARRFR